MSLEKYRFKEKDFKCLICGFNRRSKEHKARNGRCSKELQRRRLEEERLKAGISCPNQPDFQ